MAAILRTVGIFVIICFSFVTFVESAKEEEENVAAGLKLSTTVKAPPTPQDPVTVYMAEEKINVPWGPYIESVPIHIFRSGPVTFTTFFNLNLNYNSSVSRFAYLEKKSLEIYPGDRNTTTYLQFDSDSRALFEDMVYTISIAWCESCLVGSPNATVLTVIAADVAVNVTFSQETFYGYEWDDYNQITVITNYELADKVELPMKIESNGTAQYSTDYSFDSYPPTLTLQRSTKYHFMDVRVTNDQIVEPDEYFYLSFDEKKFPKNIVADGIRTAKYIIQDDDYPRLVIRGVDETYLEAVGSVDIIVETNVIRDYPMEINVTMQPSYEDRYGTAIEGEDFVPFFGLYYIPAGENGTTIQVTLIDDDVAEQEELLSFGVTLTIEGFNSLYDYCTIRIEDDETKNNPLVVSFANSSVTVSESVGTLNLYITANLKTNGELLLEYFPSERNGMVEYRDYTAFFNATVRRDIILFEASSEYLVQVEIIDDCDVEGTEEVTLAISHLTFGTIDPRYQNLTIVVEDNDHPGDVHCSACACSGGGDKWTTDSPTSEPDPVPLMFSFEIDEINIYEGECSFYDIIVRATRPTSATVFIGIQPWELTYGEDFTISDKKLVFDDSDWKNFSFRALQDMEDEDTESTLVTIAYVSEGEIGPWNAILVNVLDESDSSSGSQLRSKRSVEDLEETRSENLASTTIATGLLAGLVSSLFVVIATGILLGISLVVRKKKLEEAQR